eukprot:2827530-Alexandrium_andersonii.AAC.1
MRSAGRFTWATKRRAFCWTSRFQDCTVSKSAPPPALWMTAPQGVLRIVLHAPASVHEATGRVGRVRPAPDALHVPPPGVDTGSVDDVPAAGAEGLPELPGVFGVHVARL